MAAVELSRSMNNNLTRVYVGSVTLWFSYETCVAFQIRGHLRVVAANVWSNTTGRHLTAIDGGSKEAKAARLGPAEFQPRLVEVMDQIERAMVTA